MSPPALGTAEGEGRSIPSSPDTLVQIDDFDAYLVCPIVRFDLRKWGTGGYGSSFKADAFLSSIAESVCDASSPSYLVSYNAQPTPFNVSTITIITGINAKVDLDLVFRHIACGLDCPDIINVRFCGRPHRGIYMPRTRRGGAKPSVPRVKMPSRKSILRSANASAAASAVVDAVREADVAKVVDAVLAKVVASVVSAVTEASTPPDAVSVDKPITVRGGNMFLNQVTFDVAVGEGRKVSAKLFRDGKMQLAGCKCEAEGYTALEVLTAELQKICDVSALGKAALRVTDKEAADLRAEHANLSEQEWRDRLAAVRTRRVKPALLEKLPTHTFDYVRRGLEVVNLDQPLMRQFEIVMINSDFDAGAPIDKERLRCLLRDKYNLFCTPESSKYPGINAKFISSVNCIHGCSESDDPLVRQKCALAHKRKKVANGCVAVSLLAFAQGKVILTGGKSLQQITEAYEFITRVFREDYAEFCPRTSHSAF